MAENRDAGVDPRFDPVFQRGYDPTVHGGRRARSAPRHATGPVPVESVRETPPAAADAKPVAPTPPAAADADLTLRARNPFRLALLITSIVSIVAAGFMIWNQIGEDIYYGGFSGSNQAWLFRSQLIATLPVPLLTGGILGIILWLAIGAMAHRGPVDASRVDE